MAKDIEFGKRIAWLRINRGLEQKPAAVAMGILYGTYQPYEYGKRPSWRKIEQILSFYQCSKSWLLTGEGVPYPKEGGPEPSVGHAYIKDAAAPYPTASRDLIDPTSAPAREFSIDEDLILSASVLKSRTHYATALHLNIRSFVAGVSAETTVSRCQDDLRVQGELIAQLQARLDGMDKQNSKLREEMEALKKTGGDSPPIALEMDHAAHTGTGNPAI
ncbi:MAG: helix-turn-helix transcriptional regulator [Deltaproteobacteria bacterium]|nr:helix-turn-helix transcriptional regulator [Deltaproteobacteria bacterium]